MSVREVGGYALGAAMIAFMEVSGPVIALYEYFRARRGGYWPSGMYTMNRH